MTLIEELKKRSADAENTKRQVITEIIAAFSKELNADTFETHLAKRIRDTEIKERKAFLMVEFWEYHDGCTTTNFHCGGITWYNPDNKDGYESRRYKGIELKTISQEVCQTLSTMLANRMRDLGFYIVSRERKRHNLGYYEEHFYFGW